MTQAYQPAQHASSAETERARSDEVLYWTRLKQVAVFQEPTSVTSLALSPVAPFPAASTAGLRLSLYDSVVAEQTSVVTRFKAPVYGVNFRNDGRLMVIGGDEGKARVYDLFLAGGGVSKAPLRTIRASNGAVHGVRFTAGGQSVLTLGDDGKLKEWHLAASHQVVREVNAHVDCARVLVPSLRHEHLVVTGGYDHKIKLWDLRTDCTSSVLEMACDLPVEAAIFLPREQMLAAAAGSVVRFFDVAGGGRKLGEAQHHHKTVTSIALSTRAAQIITAGIDKRVNVIRISDYSLVHSTSMPSAVFSLAISRDDKLMVTGMGNLVGMYRRTEGAKQEKATAGTASNKAIVRTAAAAVTVEEKGEEKTSKEIHAKSTDELRLSCEDTLLRKFQFGALLRKLFFKKKTYHHPDKIVGWLRVVVARQGALPLALAGQPCEVILGLIRFVTRHLFQSNYASTLTAVAECLIEVYHGTREEEIAAALLSLRQAVQRELGVQKQLLQIIGCLEMLAAPPLEVSADDDAVWDEGDPTKIFGEITFSSIPLHLIDKPEEKQKVDKTTG